MAGPTHTPEAAQRALAWPLRLTRAGMVAERITRAFWPFWSLVFVGLSIFAFGVHDTLRQEILWAILAILGMAILWALIHGIRRFRWPSAQAALTRLDLTLPGRPISALGDAQAIGAGDIGSEAVWHAHIARMAERVRSARAVQPDLRVSSLDRYGLRYVALTGFVTAVLFGSLWRVADLPDAALAAGAAQAAGPAWEGWVEPPAYTSKPSLYLNDISAGTLPVPQGSRVTLRLYGEVGALDVTETVSGRDTPSDTPQMAQSFDVVQEGTLSISGDRGRVWDVVLLADQAPTVEFTGMMQVEADGQMTQSYTATDDYGIRSGVALVTLSLPMVDRRYGLTPEPDLRAPLEIDLPMPFTGDRREFSEAIVENLSEHPWAGLPVQIRLTVTDDNGQKGSSGAMDTVLPGRRFFEPLAKAIIEQRRDILWSRSNAKRTSQVLRAISYFPDEIFRQESAYLQLKEVIRQLEDAVSDGGLSMEAQDEIAAALWDIALQIEEGDLKDALERLQRAQERLAEAMRNGASKEEIQELMDELRQAMNDYIRQLAEQQQQDGDQQQSQSDQQQQDGQQITGDQLQQLLDRLQQLMEEGRMAEAQQLMQQLQEMLENMEVTQGQNGQQSPGDQAMQGLSETLRDQQGLSDEAFRDLQEQFNPNQGQGQQGEQQGQNQQGEGQQDGQGQGQGQQEGGQPDAQSLADRQQALRNELRRQEQNLPGLGGEAGEATRDALDRAGRAMDDAEDALRQNDLAGALDDQSRAMEALREGIRNLGEAMAEAQQQAQPGQQGQAMGEAGNAQERDPLGRERGAQGRVGSDENMLGGEDVYGRAQELMDEIRRRSSEQERPDIELDYLKRLLDRF